jgi:putative ABC transport system permease protein
LNIWALAWRLARRELDLRFRGLRLLLVCLFLGVGALAAIGSLTQSMARELAARGSTLLGGDVEFAVSQRSATPAEIGAMRTLGTVSATIGMPATAVLGAGPRQQTIPVELKSIDGAYPLYGALTLADGRSVRAPATHNVWIAQALAERSGARIGQTVKFGTASFRIAGVMADEPDRLGEGFTLGPVAIIASADMAQTGLIQPGSLYKTKYRLRLPPSADPAATATAFKRAFPAGGWDTKTRDRASPGAARFIERMGQFLLLVGLSALVIAGIGIANGVSSYLAARRSSIAALKVLGATSALITRIYLLQIGVVAIAGIAAGLIVGAVAVPLIVWSAGDILPVTPGFRVEIAPLALAAAYGLLISLAFTARPLSEAGSVPAAGLLRGTFGTRPIGRRSWIWVGAAGAAVVALAMLTADQPWLTATFLASIAGVLLVLAAFGRGVSAAAAALPRPRRPLLRLALASLHRPGARTGTLVVALGLGLTLFVLLAAIRTSIDANIARTIPARAPSLFALDIPSPREAEFRALVTRTIPTAVIKAIPAMRGTITGYGGTRVADLKAIPDNAWALRGERGLTYSQTLPEGSSLTAGAWWPKDYAGPPLVSIDERLADALHLKIGDKLDYSLLGVERSARIASFRRIDWETMGFNYVLVFSPNAISDAPHNLAATIDLPPGKEGLVTRALVPAFPSVSVIEVGGVLAQIRTIVAGMAAAITAAASVAILAGIAVLVGAIAAAREVRIYDSVILKTLGATRGQILIIQALEYALLSLILAAVALALGLGGAWYVVVKLFDFAWLPDPVAIGVTLLAGTVVTMGLGLAGGWPVLTARPARALRQL